MTDDGCDKAIALQSRMDGKLRLAAYNAHAAMRLLGDCAGKALDYYLHITPGPPPCLDLLLPYLVR